MRKAPWKRPGPGAADDRRFVKRIRLHVTFILTACAITIIDQIQLMTFLTVLPFFGAQEIGGSNPLAETNYFKRLERILIEPVLFFMVSRRWDRCLSLISCRYASKSLTYNLFGS
jgi:hypothetical protein